MGPFPLGARTPVRGRAHQAGTLRTTGPCPNGQLRLPGTELPEHHTPVEEIQGLCQKPPRLTGDIFLQAVLCPGQPLRCPPTPLLIVMGCQDLPAPCT